MLKKLLSALLIVVSVLLLSVNSTISTAPHVDDNSLAHENAPLDSRLVDASKASETENEDNSRPKIKPRAYSYNIEFPDFEENKLEPGTKYSPVSTMYHSINETPFTSLTNLFVKPYDFEDHLKKIDELGYKYIFADDFNKYDVKTIMLTFDDGYEDNYTEMFPLLKKYNAKATIFMITSEIDRPGYLTSAQIREMSSSGLVRFASHTHDHYNLTSLNEDDIRYQFKKSKEILEELTGYKVDSVCYPGGSITDNIAKIAAEYFSFGYTTVNSSYTLDCDPMRIPRVRVSRGVTGKGLEYLIG